MLDLSFEFAFQFPDWHRDAVCQEHPEIEFFPEQGQANAPAKAVCQECLVQSECLAWALEQGTLLQGIWGGTSQRERKELTKSGEVKGELVRRYGVRAVQGRQAERERERDGEWDARRWSNYSFE